MRPREEIYDALLRFQVNLSFDLELGFFHADERWGAARQVIDFGSGNCFYARKLAQEFPEKNFICVEKDKKLLARATRPLPNMTLLEGSYENIVCDQPFDFFVARHALSYLPDRLACIQWVSAHSAPCAAAIIIDADDSRFQVHPPMPMLESGNEKFKEDLKARGGQRNLGSALSAEWNQVGFTEKRHDTLVVHSDIAGRRDTLFAFMRAVAEFDHGSPLPDPVTEELDSWHLNFSSYMQYGLFLSSYHKT